VLAVIAALKSVLRTQGTTWSIPLLQPVAVGVLVAAGYVFQPPDPSGSRPACNCSLSWVWRLAKAQGWRFKKPYGDARKAPANADQLGRDIMLRLCYLRFVYKIPPALVVNADQTGIHYVQMKGKGLTDGGHTHSVQGGGDKRQCTGMIATAADGTVLAGQMVRTCISGCASCVGV